VIEPHFDLDFTRGKVGEDLVATFLADLEGKKIEVKTDYRVRETGNVYVETWQYSKPDASDKRPSGINITQAEYFCFASPTGQGFLMVKTEALKEVLRGVNPPESRQPKINPHTNASIGRLVRVSDILSYLGLWKQK
jgi:hypothetical protein